MGSKERALHEIDESNGEHDDKAGLSLFHSVLPGNLNQLQIGASAWREMNKHGLITLPNGVVSMRELELRHV